MRFTNLTRATEIGANSYLLELGGQRLVLDCGMHPKLEGEAALPNLHLVPDGSLDSILISHSHLDHIGSLPVLMRRQPQARVLMSAPTARLGEVLLHNSVNVMSKPNGSQPAAGDSHPPVVHPLFTHRETDQSSRLWQDCSLRQPWSLDGERLARPEEAEVSFELFDAGHILGSTGILIRAEGRRIFYSGDVNFLDQTVSRAAAFPEEGVDVLIMETTRGDHPLAPGFQRAAEETRFVNTLREVFERDGAALIPVFALGKTQEVLAMFLQYKQRGLLGDVPVYIGGLSTKMTEVYDRFASSAPRRLQGLSLLHSVAPYVLSGREAGNSPIKPRRIYALSSGMMTEHTLSNVFARRMLSNPRHGILFVGYADPDSPAGRLRAAAPGELVSLADDAPAVERRCQLEVFDFSAHSQRDDILGYIRRLKPKKVVLVHGDPPAIAWFQKTLALAEPEMEVIVPSPGVAVDL
jgi:Cft2 family RNA processing exonuclease